MASPRPGYVQHGMHLLELWQQLPSTAPWRALSAFALVATAGLLAGVLLAPDKTHFEPKGLDAPHAT